MAHNRLAVLRLKLRQCGARLIVAAIAQRFTLSLTHPGQEVKPDALITLRPLGGLPMRVARREPVAAAKSSLEAVSSVV